MGTMILLFLIPLIVWIIACKFFFRHEFAIIEMMAQLAITGIVLAGLTVFSYKLLTSDTMLVNGHITELNPVKKSCNMFWSDSRDSFCTNYTTRQVRNGSSCSTVNKVTTCRPKYKTQYRSIYSWERRYFLESTVNEYEISRIDSQGVNTPPRFAETKVGDPVTGEVSYDNYIQADAGNLFNSKLENLPVIEYPRVYDYYHVNRLLVDGYNMTPEKQKLWNKDLERINSLLAEKKANVIVAVTNKTALYSEELAQVWDAHNINDVVVVIGMSGETVSWVDVRSWSSDKMVNITIRDEIKKIGTLDIDKIDSSIILNVVKYYQAQKMEDFEYMADDIPPPTWLLIVAGLILLIVTPAVTFFLSNNETKD